MSEPTADSGKHESPAPDSADEGNTGVHDRVVMASRHPDGTPAQSKHFRFIGDIEHAVTGAAHQIASALFAAQQTSSDVSVNPTVEEQAAVQDEANAKAEAEVTARHEDIES